MGPKRRISFLAFFLIWARYKGWDVPQHHVRICVWLERFWWHGRVGVLEVFRGAAKSTIVAVFQAWILYLDQSVHILDQAADDKTARKLSRDTRHVLNRHPLCRGMLGRADQAVESINVLGNPDARNASVSAHGVLSNVTSSRAEIVIFDDVEVPKNTRSDAARAHLRERMDEATHILVPGGKKLYIGTPHAFDSIYDEQAAAGAENNLTLRVYGEKGMLEWQHAAPNYLRHAPQGAPVLIMRLQAIHPTAEFWPVDMFVVSGDKSGPMVGIRSNLLNGLPR